MRTNRIIAGAIAAVVVISLIVAAVVYQHRATKREELHRYQTRVLHLEGEKTRLRLLNREAGASDSSKLQLPPDEEAELVELHHRIASMEADGVGK